MEKQRWVFVIISVSQPWIRFTSKHPDWISLRIVSHKTLFPHLNAAECRNKADASGICGRVGDHLRFFGRIEESCRDAPQNRRPRVHRTSLGQVTNQLLDLPTWMWNTTGKWIWQGGGWFNYLDLRRFNALQFVRLETMNPIVLKSEWLLTCSVTW